MAHPHFRRLSTPPPMSPATTSAHNFYNSFAPPRHNSPPGSYQQPPPPPRPSSAAQNQGPGGQFYPGGGAYVNAQYYQHGPPSGLGLSGFPSGGGGGGGGSSHSGSAVGGRKHGKPGGPQSPPPLQTSFGNMNLGNDDRYDYSHAHSPPPVPNTAPPVSSGRAGYGPPYTGRPNTPGNNSNGNARDSRPTASERMPGAFPDDGPASRPPVIGVKAAAAQRAREQAAAAEAASNQGDSYWGYLFDHDTNPPTAKELLANFLRGVANYIIEDFEPRESLVITPPKMKAFYTKFKAVNGEPLNWDNFFFGRPVKGLSEIYQALNCHHHLVPPKDSAGSAPTVPGLTPRGFERWMTVQILSDPDREARRLIAVLKQCPIQNPLEKDAMMRRFPKTLTRDAFPKYPDSAIKELWELFVPDDEPQPSNRSASRPRTKSRDRAKSRDRDRDRERDREYERQKEMEKREIEHEKEMDRREREYVEKQQFESQREAEMRYREAFPSSSPDPDLRKYESMPPPPIPGIERQRQPYARAPPPRKEDVTEVESDDEYTSQDKVPPERRTRRSNGTGEIELYPNSNKPYMKGRTHSHGHTPSQSHPKQQQQQQHYAPSSGSESPDHKLPPDLDREEEDLYAVMAAKRAEIEKIERRLANQSNSSMSQAMVQSPRDSGPPPQRMPVLMDPEEEEAMERARRADQDWEREAREREKWVEAGRQKYHRDISRGPPGEGGARASYLQGDYTVETPISNYSWRDSFRGAPAGPDGKRIPGAGGRLSGGGEWEVFHPGDEMSPPRGRRSSIGERLYSDGNRMTSMAMNYGYEGCGCQGYDHPECAPGR